MRNHIFLATLFCVASHVAAGDGISQNPYGPVSALVRGNINGKPFTLMSSHLDGILKSISKNNNCQPVITINFGNKLVTIQKDGEFIGVQFFTNVAWLTNKQHITNARMLPYGLISDISIQYADRSLNQKFRQLAKLTTLVTVNRPRKAPVTMEVDREDFGKMWNEFISKSVEDGNFTARNFAVKALYNDRKLSLVKNTGENVGMFSDTGHSKPFNTDGNWIFTECKVEEATITFNNKGQSVRDFVKNLKTNSLSIE